MWNTAWPSAGTQFLVALVYHASNAHRTQAQKHSTSRPAGSVADTHTRSLTTGTTGRCPARRSPTGGSVVGHMFWPWPHWAWSVSAGQKQRKRNCSANSNEQNYEMDHGGNPGREGGCEESQKAGPALAGVGQWIEHWPTDQKIAGSIPS